MSRSPRFVVVDCYLDEMGGARNVSPHFPGSLVLRASQETIPEVIDADGVIITGSAASVLESLPWAVQLERSIARTAERGSAILGLCFGHQLLARAVFGDRAVRRSVVPELGWGELEVLGNDALFENVPSSFKCFLSHKDEVDPGCSGLPAEARVLSRSKDCPVEAFRVHERPLWGVQFHAEMGLAESRELVESRLGADSSSATRLLHDAVETSDLARRLFANFSRQVVLSRKA